VRGAEALEGRIDLHGMDQDRARSALTAFVLDAHARQARAVLVITGKGADGEGVLRRRAPQWLSAPPMNGLVAGIAAAHPRVGGAGALYVALRRRGG
jgi:DNA-nicking Smr family endonuclease